VTRSVSEHGLNTVEVEAQNASDEPRHDDLFLFCWWYFSLLCISRREASKGEHTRGALFSLPTLLLFLTLSIEKAFLWSGQEIAFNSKIEFHPCLGNTCSFILSNARTLSENEYHLVTSLIYYVKSSHFSQKNKYCTHPGSEVRKKHLRLLKKMRRCSAWLPQNSMQSTFWWHKLAYDIMMLLPLANGIKWRYSINSFHHQGPLRIMWMTHQWRKSLRKRSKSTSWNTSKQQTRPCFTCS